MFRKYLHSLQEWKTSPYRKPLILNGIRQVGKTWLLKEFGKQEYQNTVYVNFEENPELGEFFERTKDISRILENLSLALGEPIEKESTLIIFDEIQLCPNALTALKYFAENGPEYHVTAAGSLLGVLLAKPASFPVGKVDFLTIHPMTFTEFLYADGAENLVRYLDSLREISQIPEIFFHQLSEKLKVYFVTGGMPEAVFVWTKTQNRDLVDKTLNNILTAYERDFAKHMMPKDFPRASLIWNSIPSQLAKENKKFIYGLVREGSRAKDYETALMWLSDCGLVHKVSRVNTAGIPLKAYEDLKAFKLFVVDVGLLGCMTGLRGSTLLDGNDLFVEFKGALNEQYVCQQLKTIVDLGIYYYTNDRGSCEIDFVIDNGEQAIPVEVQAEINLQTKSLKTYREKFTPECSIRTSMADYKEEDWLINLPLYAIEEVGKASSKR